MQVLSFHSLNLSTALLPKATQGSVLRSEKGHIKKPVCLRTTQVFCWQQPLCGRFWTWELLHKGGLFPSFQSPPARTKVPSIAKACQSAKKAFYSPHHFTAFCQLITLFYALLKIFNESRNDLPSFSSTLDTLCTETASCLNPN